MRFSRSSTVKNSVHLFYPQPMDPIAAAIAGQKLFKKTTIMSMRTPLPIFMPMRATLDLFEGEENFHLIIFLPYH